MTLQEKISMLRQTVAQRLDSLAGRRCVLVGVPYHTNIGDVLIWQGTMDFLSHMRCRCLRQSSILYVPEGIDRDTVILMIGGGNFGDVWPQEQDFKLRVLRAYPDNEVVILPQSIHYSSEATMLAHAAEMARHSHLTICARDLPSLALLERHFPSHRRLLVPDMAFCISDRRLARYRGAPATDRSLYLRRMDVEYDPATGIPGAGFDTVSDWPTMMPGGCLSYTVLGKMRTLYQLSALRSPALGGAAARMLEWYAGSVFRPDVVGRGAGFLSGYGDIVTTRLHVLILSALLHKPVRYIDNTTRKISAFAGTWLGDVPDIGPYTAG